MHTIDVTPEILERWGEDSFSYQTVVVEADGTQTLVWDDLDLFTDWSDHPPLAVVEGKITMGRDWETTGSYAMNARTVGEQIEALKLRVGDQVSLHGAYHVYKGIVGSDALFRPIYGWDAIAVRLGRPAYEQPDMATGCFG